MSGDLEALAGRLSRRLAEAQAKERMPGPSAAVARDGEIVWSEAIGLADVEAGGAATVDDQYRIGSITKVITAICVMQLRDEGRLDLDDPLSAHIAESAHRGPTIRRMLSHLSGLQREPVGDVWVTMVMPSMADVVASLGDAELVLKPGAGVALLEPRLRAARRDRAAAARHAVSGGDPPSTCSTRWA